MQPPPRASLVITTFNRRTSVLRAIESARRQTVQHLDIVVVDDASTDGTAEAVAGISDHRLRYVRLAENSGGPSRPVNVGVHHPGRGYRHVSRFGRRVETGLRGARPARHSTTLG